MIQSVILTVKTERSKQEYDMILPANVKVSELTGKLLETLKSMEPEYFLAAGGIGLRCDGNGRYLSGEETLESAHIWDGSIITVVKR